MNKSICKVLAIFMALSVFFSLTGCDKEESEGEDDPTEAPVTEASITNPLTGTGDLSNSASGKRPLAIVVENSPAARPQWGFGSADITIEGLVEGGITRMLWLYSDASSIPKVGPVRSARIDFVEMAEGFDAIYVHFGGAATAYTAIRNRDVDDIDGGGQGNYRGTAQYFKRDTSRSSRGSEHTAYTTGEWLSNAVSATGMRADIGSAYASPFSFNETAKELASGTCAEVKFTFSSSYKHTFKYNAETKLYYNYMNTSEMVDENGNQMSVTNVILLYFPSYSSIPNTAGSIDMDLSGGKGVVVSNGTYENITWTKGSTTDMLKLYGADGKEMKLNAGKSYIGLIPASNSSATAIS